MKKIITIMAAILFGMSIKAATVDWSVDVYDLSETSDTTTYTLYSFASGDVASTLAAALNTSGKFNQTAFESALSAATKSTASFDEFGWADGNINGVSGSSISFLILTDGTAADSTFYFASNVDITGYTYEPPAGNPGVLYVDTSSFVSGTVGTAAVPEPTSGLLMLVGLAGLALRRRRA